MYDPSKSWSIQGENDHTEVKDSVADSIFNVSGNLPGIHSGNVVGTPVRPMLVDPDNLDFRPKAGSPAAGAGPYPDPTADYWTPGHDGTSESRVVFLSVAEARVYYDRIRANIHRETGS